MFPYRRGGGKKRGKGGGPGPRYPRDGGGGGSGGGRRVPGSAGEMLSLLQPTTKALAQMLAGNARVSGQLVHARNVLSQAQRLVEERAVDRMPPAQREEFLEQLARLKLTLADADEAGLFREAEPAAEQRPAVPVTADQLRDVARRLAMSGTPAPGASSLPSPPMFGPSGEPYGEELDSGEEEEAGEPSPEPAAPGPADHRRGERLRLRIASGPDAAAPVRVRDRLRLKPLKPAAGSSRD